MDYRDIPTYKSATHEQRKAFGKKVAQQRRLYGIPIKPLANELGVSSHTLRNWEIGAHLPSRLIMDELAEMFCLPLTAFFNELASNPYEQNDEEEDDFEKTLED